MTRTANPAELTWLDGCSRRRAVAAGEHIIRQGDHGTSVYFLVSGQAAVVVDEMGLSVVAELGAGEVFGEMAALSGGRRSASVVAVVDSHVIEVDAAHLREAFERLPTLRERLGRLGIARAEDNLQHLLAAA